MADQPRQAAVVEFDHVTKRYDAPTGKDKAKPTPGAVNDLSPRARSASSSGRPAAARRPR
jgi:hypothetical protein